MNYSMPTSLLSLVHSAPSAAFFAGAGVYLGWVVVFALGFRQPAAGSKGGAGGEEPRGAAAPPVSGGRRGFGLAALLRYGAVATLVGAASAALSLCLAPEAGNQPCGKACFRVDEGSDGACLAPATHGDLSSFQRPPPGEGEEEQPLGPADLLTRARVAMRFRGGRGQVQSSLEECAAWAPAEGEARQQAELQAQLLCLRGLSESAMASHEAVLARRDALLAAATTPMRSADTVKAESARLAGSALRTGCGRLAQAASALKGPGFSRKGLLEVLAAAADLEKPLKEAATAGALAGTAKAPALPELPGIEATAPTLGGSCLLGALKDLRTVLAEGRQPAPECALELLDRMAGPATQAAEEERRLKEPGASFHLGLYWSDSVTASAGSQGSWRWSRDERGWHVPRGMALAEELLLEAEQLTPEGPERGERAAIRALRLYQHAKFLALKHHDAAAEWRFEASAQLAALHRRQKLAAHALARLSYFLMLRGRQQEALELATRALNHTSDPFAEYMEVSLRRTLGGLRTVEDLQLFEDRLNSTKGHLPSPLLESQRATSQKELLLWRKAASGGFSQCFDLHDAARVLICLLCKAAFG